MDAQKKDAEPSLLRVPPPRGAVEQHLASTPRGARLKVLLLLKIKSYESSGWRITRKQ